MFSSIFLVVFILFISSQLNFSVQAVENEVKLVESERKLSAEMNGNLTSNSTSSSTCYCEQYGGSTCSGFCSGSTCPCMSCETWYQKC
jgi:hypothetical protein